MDGMASEWSESVFSPFAGSADAAAAYQEAVHLPITDRVRQPHTAPAGVPQPRAPQDSADEQTAGPEADEWDRAYARLEDYAQRYGHSRVPAGYRDDDRFLLGRWVSLQRQQYQAGDLPRDRAGLLAELPGWSWAASDDAGEHAALLEELPAPAGILIPEAWEDGFAHVEAYARAHGSSAVPADYRDPSGFPLYQWVRHERQLESWGEVDDDHRRRLEALPGWAWDPFADLWETGFAHLQRYAEREGTSMVTVHYRDEDGYRLGSWVSCQRKLQRDGTLSLPRRRRLEQLPGWTATPKDDAWDEGLGRLQAYVRRESHSRVPSDYREDDGFRLGAWVASQRTLQRQGTLAPDRRRRLEAVPTWSADFIKHTFAEGLAYLQAYAEREGHSRVPLAYRAEDGYGVGWFVSWQRRGYQHQTLPPERIEALEQLPGWTWDARDEWDEGFAHLRAFAEREGHCQVPSAFEAADGHRLGQWCAIQRLTYRQGNLAADRAGLLAAVPGWSWGRGKQDAWEEGFAHLQAFLAREGQARIPQTHREPDGYALGRWVSKQRYHHRRGKVPADRASRIEALPGWTWEPRADGWDEGFARLQAYTEREGHSDAGIGYIDATGFRLGQWVASQRRGYERGTLARERAQRLSGVPGWAWHESWERSFARLQAYSEREGHCQVPVTYRDRGQTPLGRWVHAQQMQHRDGILARDRARRLETVPGWTWQPR